MILLNKNIHKFLNGYTQVAITMLPFRSSHYFENICVKLTSHEVMPVGNNTYQNRLAITVDTVSETF